MVRAWNKTRIRIIILLVLCSFLVSLVMANSPRNKEATTPAIEIKAAIKKNLSMKPAPFL
jgi:hypothetical protein